MPIDYASPVPKQHFWQHFALYTKKQPSFVLIDQKNVDNAAAVPCAMFCTRLNVAQSFQFVSSEETDCVSLSFINKKWDGLIIFCCTVSKAETVETPIDLLQQLRYDKRNAGCANFFSGGLP